MSVIEGFQAEIEKQIKTLSLPKDPALLYEPITYFMSLGGKRMRPVLALLANQLFNGKLEDVISPALAIEIFHNFTLVHDDIMDEAPLRRGKDTVHHKWNNNIAILSGDAMLVLAYQKLNEANPLHLKEILSIFSETALEVCEGQQYDMDFETMQDVRIDEYLKMIRLKTAVLLGCALKIGAITAKASKEDAEHLYQFGINIGVAFQLQDDLLDAYADQTKFGKQIGGDIISNKKTYLLLKAFENASEVDLKQLRELIFTPFSGSNEEKVSEVMEIFDRSEVKEATGQAMDHYFIIAMQHIQQVQGNPLIKETLIALAENLMVREN